LIGEVQSAHPDVIFLSEAFTRPKIMKRLAKLGFTQSYTYFTWRNTKAELTEYLGELTGTEMAEYYRPNFFTNTPDINPFFLQTSGRAGFRVRLVLASMLSGNYGIYNGFELCEAAALPGKEEYLNSEKYEIRAWDWDREGHIKDDVRLVNRLRRWYKDAIIYQLHVKAFQDGDGDGMGDFAGLISRLDYIEELGVDTIWLLPFYPSPLRDDGYDIADYESVHPSYGDMETFRAFVEEAHRRGLRVVTELVINHTSDQHPWFQRARRAARAAWSAISTSGPTTTGNGPRRGSSFSTRSRRTGAGTRSPAPITGIASTITSPT
jgi:glycosidase